MNTPTLQGRIALVTGGSKGIGFGSAQRLMEEGAFVYITGRGKREPRRWSSIDCYRGPLLLLS